MTTFPIEEIEAAFERQRKYNNEQLWDEYCSLFTDDGVYVEHEMGTFVGPEAIKAWIVPTMAPLVNAKWEYPMEWYTIDGNRIVFKWRNVMPNVDGREGGYEFAGVTILEYAGDGKFSLQEDIYNMKETETVMMAWFAAGGTL